MCSLLDERQRLSPAKGFVLCIDVVKVDSYLCVACYIRLREVQQNSFSFHVESTQTRALRR